MSETVVKYNNPPSLAKPLGAYSHIARARATELLFIAGQVAVNEAGELVGKGDFAAQMRQVFDNLGRALGGEGLGFANVTKFTT
ncbi:MAG TPA: RidA family protein, partial [Candidatus Binataceae bacterium]|nr:RidA family protein [Candidatus Binataceae bacterium]